MIPAKVFLQSVKSNTQVSSKIIINLILNDILYSQIKPFQTKYICVTTHDQLSFQIQHRDNDKLMGSIEVKEIYKLILQNETIQLHIIPHKEMNIQPITLTCCFQPVAAYNKKRNAFLASKKLNQSSFSPVKQHPLQQSKNSALQLSFSRRDQHLETNRTNKTTDRVQNYMVGSFIEEQNQSLQSLAQQRQQILGQLFVKFKKDKI